MIDHIKQIAKDAYVLGVIFPVALGVWALSGKKSDGYALLQAGLDSLWDQKEKEN